MQRITKGVERFQETIFPFEQELFKSLANQQLPRALFITCADSRVDPNLLTQTKPGEIFHLRNAGNIIPPYSAVRGAEAATIEYAMTVLKVPHVIVCGHTDCGAMKGVMDPSLVAALPAVTEWLRHSECAGRVVRDGSFYGDEHQRLRRLIEENVVTQLLHLQTHPSVAARLAAGEVKLYGWIFEIPTGRVFAYRADKRRFEVLNPSIDALGELVPLWTPSDTAAEAAHGD